MNSPRTALDLDTPATREAALVMISDALCNGATDAESVREDVLSDMLTPVTVLAAHIVEHEDWMAQVVAAGFPTTPYVWPED